MIEILRQQADAQKTAVSALVQDVTTLDLLEHDYDIAVFFDALHHVPNYAQAIQRVYEHLAPGGFILLFEPSWLHKFSPHARKAAQRYDVTELGFSRRELRRCLNGAGFANVQQFHDPGGVYGSFRGLAGTLTRIAADFVTAFPKMKRIVTAQKPG